VREEGPGRFCNHDRFLITDQISIKVERGFDMLWSDREMQNAGLTPGIDARLVRDLNMNVVDDAGPIESDYHQLPLFGSYV